MTTAELLYQMRFCNSCITTAIDRADEAYNRGDADQGDYWTAKAERLCDRNAWIHAMWRESQHNGLGRV